MTRPVRLSSPGAGAAAVLLAILRGEPAPPEEDPRWDETLRLASAHRVAGLLHEVAALPGGVKRALRRTRAQALARHEAQEAVLARALAALSPLEVLLLKGSAIGALYPAPELRPRSDSDLLVRRGDFASACVRLEASGFVHHPATRGSNEDDPAWHERTFLCKGEALDLHQALLQPERVRLTDTLLFEQSRALAGRPRHVRALSDEDAWLVCALSLAAKELSVPLVLACDLVRLSARVDPVRLAERAREGRLLRAAGLALAWLARLAPERRFGGALLPREFLQRTQKALALSPLVTRSLFALAGRSDLLRQKPSRVTQLLRKGLLVDKPLDAGRLLVRTALRRRGHRW